MEMRSEGRSRDHWEHDLLVDKIGACTAHVATITTPGRFVVMERRIEHVRPTAQEAYILLCTLRLKGHSVPPGDIAWLRRRMREEEERNQMTGRGEQHT